MVKALLVCLLFSFSLSQSAQAVTMLPDHETFVHLSDQEQKKIIIGVMEFMVAMEAEHETGPAPYKKKVENKSKELQEKILSHIKFIQNILISSAHAATDPFEEYRLKYRQSMASADIQTKDNVCIYAGWISTMGTNKKCMHPSLSKISNYPKTPKVGGIKLGSNDIVCNPLMFGFKDPTKETLLVAVATISSINSSLDCMNQSQGVEKDGTKGKIEAEEITTARINQLKLAYTDPSEDAKDTYLRLTKLIHQTCLCPSTLKNMDKSYLDRIRPHRTCFALLNQFKYLRGNKCSPTAMDLGLNIDVLSKVVEKNLTDMEGKVNTLSSKELKSTEDLKELTNLDASFKTLLEKNTETDNFCKAQEAGIQSCKIISCSTPTTCKAKILNSQNPNTQHTVTLTKGTGSVTSIATQSTKKVAVSCSLPALVCSVGECMDGKCAITVAGASLKDPADSSVQFGDETTKSIDVIPTGLDEKSVFPVVCTAPPKDAKCEVSACDTVKKTGITKCEFTVPGFATKIPKQTSFDVPKDYAEKNVTIDLDNGKSVKCDIQDDAKKSKCDMTIVANADAKKVDVTLRLTILDGDVPTAPTFDPSFEATTDDKKLEYKATIDLSTIADDKLITASKFSTKFPDAVCSDSFPKGDAKPEIKLTQDAPKKNDSGIFIIIIKAEITVTTIDKTGLKWDGGKETSDKQPDQREVQQTDKDQIICAKHDQVPSTDPKGTCITVKKSADGSKATLNLAGINRSNANFDVKAKVTLDGKDFKDVLSGGYTLVWFEKNKPEPTIEEKALSEKKAADKKAAENKLAEKVKPKKSTGLSGDSDATTKTKTPEKNDPNDAKAIAGEVQNGTALLYTTPIGTAKYDICANLMKNGKIEANDCKTVPGYTAPVQQQLGPPPVPGAYRYRRW